ncbi:hypothetical protein [Amycolatopsis aidingensis]|uniref:hypothetical protein n=1 Tax=Amycolatopsis aidingensis TaxID=2842453 RepID=UPI001C0BADE3|nr:hypothetical protein [Amycolatopsis aidingensis]
MDLAELLDRTGLDVLDHLERQATIPVLDGPQAQGDLIVLPLSMLTPVDLLIGARWRPVPLEGVELVRGAAGNNPHTLVAESGACQWTTAVRDPLGLGIVAFENTAPAYLVHPEHGGSGVAAGCWLVRRQQERGVGARKGNMLIAD